MSEFAFTEEHDELRETVRRFLDAKSTESAVRAAMETERGFDPDVWTQMAQQMGLQGLVIPEAHGGAGLGWVELGIVMEQMGRTLLCAPYLSSAVLAPATLLAAATPEAQAAVLPGIASGDTLATLAFVEEHGSWDPGTIAMKARRDGSTWRLEGTKTYVLDGHTADVVMVAARVDEGLALFQIAGDAAGLGRTLLPTLDLTRKLARLDFDGVQAERISTSGDVTDALRGALALTVAALAAEQAGGAQRCLEMSTEFARTRLQFGRPIGSFQAIKHRCADMLVEAEFAKSAAQHATFTAASGTADEIATAASLAKSYCSEAFFHAAAETIQVHGGMGFTWEHPAHLYFKRAKSSAVLFGEAVEHRERLAEHLGL
jgi:alkylation response protein AidB-like acyl-CoA dehydrogenase